MKHFAVIVVILMSMASGFGQDAAPPERLPSIVGHEAYCGDGTPFAHIQAGIQMDGDFIAMDHNPAPDVYPPVFEVTGHCRYKGDTWVFENYDDAVVWTLHTYAPQQCTGKAIQCSYAPPTLNLNIDPQ